jgi:hypothetical protein
MCRAGLTTRSSTRMRADTKRHCVLDRGRLPPDTASRILPDERTVVFEGSVAIPAGRHSFWRLRVLADGVWR